jgi:hypothetical protein
MPTDLREQIAKKIAALGQNVDRQVAEWRRAGDPVAFRQVELAIAAVGRVFSDAVTELILKDWVADPELQADASIAARATGAYRHGGTREVGVTLLGGSRIRVRAEYLKVNRRGQPGRRRENGRRGRGGTGIYPVLAVLGIALGVTPALAGEICRQVADSDSVRAGRAALDRRGIDLGHKQTLRIVNGFSHRAVQQRNAWLAKARLGPAASGPLKGKRVVIATDGGRLRERCPASRGRRRAKTGHRRYDAPWREPKLLTIYVIGKDGTIDDEFRPVYDGTLGDCDVIFDMLVGYLKALGAHEARELILLGDGAKWIWERAANLVARVGIASGRVTQIIDWCHAVGTLHEIAEARASWAPTERERWIKRAKKKLHAGKIDDLLALIDALAIGRRAKAVSEHRDYFARNASRMQYASFVAARIPIGSGAIESAVRRIINMRMKSNGMFWLEVNAEGMLLLRSYLKADHLDALVDWSIAAAVPWWNRRRNGKPCEMPLETEHQS